MIPVAEGDADPIAVTWCPIRGSGVGCDTTVGGRRLTFGVSGKLADDDLVPYDRETDSEWKRSTGGLSAAARDVPDTAAREDPGERHEESAPPSTNSPQS